VTFSLRATLNWSKRS